MKKKKKKKNNHQKLACPKKIHQKKKVVITQYLKLLQAKNLITTKQNTPIEAKIFCFKLLKNDNKKVTKHNNSYCEEKLNLN